MSKQKINKLFYNKWPFKIECFIKGGSRVKYAGPEKIRMWANLDNFPWYTESSRFGHNYQHREQVDKFDLLKFANQVEPFMQMPDDIKIRAEGAHFNLFCKDPEIKDKICGALHPWIREVFGPDTQEELEFLLDNNRKVICNHLPYNKFKFKVVLKDYVEDVNKKNALYNFLLKQDPDSIKISNDTVRWFNHASVYKQDPFFYIVDDKQLVFIRLVFNDIKTVYEYVERDSINTTL